MILEVSTHGSTIKRDHDSFVIRTKDGTTDIPAEKVDSIIVTANALVSTPAMKLAMEKQIQMVFAGWSGKPFGRVWASSPGRAASLRRWQYLNQDTPAGARISWDIVTRKIGAQRRFLAELKSNRERRIPELEEAISAIDGTLLRLRHERAASKDRLRGMEGWSARLYFAALSSVLPERWQFKERSQHSARDGFNAALNYAYGMEYAAVEKIIILCGLDPSAGFYHVDAYGKPTLSYDIIEVVRAAADRIEVPLFTKKEAADDWFEAQEDGSVFLTKNGRASVMSKYAGHARQIEKDAWNHCRRIIRAFEGEK